MKSKPAGMPFSGPVVVLRRCLADIAGDPRKGLVLGQMLYWQEHAKSEDGYFWKSARQLEDELMHLMSRRTISRLLDDLVQAGLLSRRSGDNPTKRAYWYLVPTSKIIEKLRQWTAEQSKKSAGPTGQSIGPTDQSIGTSGPYIRDHTTETTSQEIDPLPCRKGRNGHSAHGHGSTEPETDDDLSAAILAVDRALSQAFEIVRYVLWSRLEDDVHQRRRVEEVFGATFRISWSSTERTYLREILAFCRMHWPERRPERAVAALIRASFTLEGKPFQILKHWVLHNHGRPTLRTYLTMGGGRENPEARLDVLEELSTVPRISLFLGEVGEAASQPAG